MKCVLCGWAHWKEKKKQISIKYPNNSSCLLCVLLSHLAPASPLHTLCEGKYIQSGIKGLGRKHIHFKCCWFRFTVRCQLMFLLSNSLKYVFINTHAPLVESQLEDSGTKSFHRCKGTVCVFSFLCAVGFMSDLILYTACILTWIWFFFILQ